MYGPLRERLQQSSDPLLLVLDNVWSEQDLPGLLPCAPPSGSRVLLTSRDKRLKPPRGCNVYELPGLEEAEASKLLRSHACGSAQ